jgi:hypothetical protein
VTEKAKRKRNNINRSREGHKNKQNMKRSILIIALALLTGAAAQAQWFGEKDGNLGIYDKKVSPDQLCVLRIDNRIGVNRFDDKSVTWYYSFEESRRLSGDYTIQIPSGTHTFAMNYFIPISNSSWHAIEGGRLQYSFEAGKIYRINLEVGTGTAGKPYIGSYIMDVLPGQTQEQLLEEVEWRTIEREETAKKAAEINAIIERANARFKEAWKNQ